MGNPHRKRGTGRGTPSAWRNSAGIEGEPASQESFVEPNKKEFKTTVIDLNSKRPIDAKNVHSVPSIPNPATEINQSIVTHAKVEKNNPVSSRDELEYWIDEEDNGEVLNAVAEVFNRAREERLAGISARMEKELSPLEQRFIDTVVDDYIDYFFEKKGKADQKRIRVDENWVEAVRQFYIDEGKRWGLKRQIAPEKAALLGGYLELKLPAGFPEKKKKVNPERSEIYTGEKSREFQRLLKFSGKLFRKWIRNSEDWGDEYGDADAKKKALVEHFQAALKKAMIMDPELKKHFEGDSLLQAIERVTNNVKIFNNIK
jgi:hypothetical protein